MDSLAKEYSAPTTERLLGIERSLATAVATTEARSVLIPLGLTHPDHEMVSDAALRAVLNSNLDTYVYMEMPYGQARPSHVRRRLRHLRRTYDIDPVPPYIGDLQTKAEAVNAYNSQIVALREGFGKHFNGIFTDPEKYWRLQPFARKH